MKERSFVKKGLVKSMVKEMIMREFDRANITDVDIIETPVTTRIVISSAKPQSLLKNKRRLYRVTKMISNKWRLNNPRVEIKEVSDPFLIPEFVTKIMANKIARGESPRRVIGTMVRRVMSAGAKGCEIYAKGSFRRGLQNTKFREQAGHIKKAGDPATQILEDVRQVQLGHGVIGVCVRIVPPDYEFPDQIIVPDPVIEMEEMSDENGNTKNE